MTQSLARILLISGLLVAFLAPRGDFLDFIDEHMFKLGRWLLPVPEVSDDIYTVSLAADYMRNPEDIKKLRQLVSKLKKNDSASVTLLMSQAPALDYQKTDNEKSDNDEWELTQGEITKLAWVLDNKKILVGVPVEETKRFSLIKQNSDSYADYFQNLMFTNRMSFRSTQLQTNADYKVQPYSIDADSKHKFAMIWMDDHNNMVPDLVLEIYKQTQRIKQHDWYRSEGIKLNGRTFYTDYAGQLIGYFSATTSASINSINIDELLSLNQSKIKNKIFIIGDDNKALNSVASKLLSVLSNSLYHTPAWAHWVQKLAIIVIFIYLLLFVARLQKNTSYLLSILLIFVALVFQYGLLVIQSIWLPFVSLYIFLIAGHIIMRIKKSIDSSMDALMLRSHEALWHLGQYQYENGDHDRALTSLLKCFPTLDVLETMYNIGLGYERRRQYDKALQLYSEIDVRDGAFKDVKKRLNTLSDVSGNHKAVLSPGQHAKTLLIPDMGLQLPVFGRYEIERELGRGAMGVVYLGKDPKINRQVAIKTLDYSQFSENEIKTIKSRFFREAEAAGRLNHNNIVTVYDVGEEEDFAFIAMDYVQGMSLGEFSRPDTLLPVIEVYEIIAEVAESLDYAHSQNIVHRDIKPSNIMYNPETHKIKITDFGIARITDSVRTRTGSFMGSPSYMAPEQMTGANVDNHADIYALGVSFYQLLTGHLPFEAESIGNLAYIITNEKHKPIRDIRPDLPASASRIINKALQKKPGDRYNTGKDMADAIRRGMPKGSAE